MLLNSSWIYKCWRKNVEKMRTHVFSHVCCIENNAFCKILQEMWQRLQGHWNIWWWSEHMWCHEDVIYMLGKWGSNTNTAQFAVREITQWIECEVHVCAQVSLQALTVCTLDFLIIIWMWGPQELVRFEELVITTFIVESWSFLWWKIFGNSHL